MLWLEASSRVTVGKIDEGDFAYGKRRSSSPGWRPVPGITPPNKPYDTGGKALWHNLFSKTEKGAQQIAEPLNV